jgi:hypothetical protein
VALSETWLTDNEDDQYFIQELIPTGYAFKHVPRNKANFTQGGGLAVLHKQTLDVAMIPVTATQTFEYMETVITTPNKVIRLLNVYRPPKSEKHVSTRRDFIQEFGDFMERYSVCSGELLLVGDFNFHMELVNDPDTKSLFNLFQSLDLIQHVTEPTHTSGHTLDLVIEKENVKPTVSKVDIRDIDLSDHFAVNVSINISKPPRPTKVISYRKLKSVDVEQFQNDIKSSELIRNPSNSLEGLVSQYDTVLRSILDTHAPVKERCVVLRSDSPWYTEELKSEKQKRRALERKYRSTGTDDDKKLYKKQCAHVNAHMAETKTKYYTELVKNCSGDQKKLFGIVDTLLHRKAASPLPKHRDPKELANQFSSFFNDKIDTIRQSLTDHPDVTVIPSQNDEHREVQHKMSSFTPLTTEEVEKIINNAKSTSCELDPIPTWLLKKTLAPLLPVITEIVNRSLALGLVPDNMKNAVVIPLIKKIILDYEVFKNYRPVSNLSFISKVTEKAASVQFKDHNKMNNLDVLYQSAYKQFHSTETALIRVQNDILRAMDDQQVCLLLLLDLSAAFDTVDHNILLTRMSNSFGIDGTPLAWIKSYLSNRTQSVIIDGVKSEPKALNCGVPQGSILGPEFFVNYASPIAEIIHRHGLGYHIYADDTQIYIFFSADDTADSVKRVEKCVAEIRAWMKQNILKLNDDKSELMLIGSRQQLSQIPPIAVQIGDAQITPSSSARNIGVIFDKYMNMEQHVITTCKVANYHLRNISRIRKYLTDEAIEQLIHAFVTAKLDYGNALLAGISDKQLLKLQRVQNTAARVVTWTRKFDHITPVLKKLHWLPVKQRIEFKILLLTFKSLHGLAPPYIDELLKWKTPGRTLRSNSAGQHLLNVPHTKCVTFGDRAYSVAAPRLWNTLPQSIKSAKTVDSFKCQLKSHLFKLAYETD